MKDMSDITSPRTERKAFPDKSFISCLCCIPRAWTLFSNDQWTRIFESHDDGLRIVKEFRPEKVIDLSEPVTFLDRVSLWIDEAIWNNRFDHLIVVAPASVLPSINRSFSPAALSRLIAEIDWPAYRRALAGGTE